LINNTSPTGIAHCPESGSAGLDLGVIEPWLRQYEFVGLGIGGVAGQQPHPRERMRMAVERVRDCVAEGRQSASLGCYIRVLSFDTLPEKTKCREQAACARIIGQCAKEGLGIDNAIEGRLELAAVQEKHSLLPQERKASGRWTV
jgi:hypothetical protein